MGHTPVEVEVERHPGPDDMAAVTALLAVAAAADGHAPLDEQRWLDLIQGRRPDLTLLLAREAGDRRDAGGMPPLAGTSLAGYGQLSRDRDTWVLEIVVHPGHRHRQPDGTPALCRDLLEAALAETRRRGGGPLRWWATRVTAEQAAAAGALGFAVERDLLQLRVPLPLDPAVRGQHPPLPVRPFRPGQDEAAWLAANNRAFAGHPEQGAWDPATLRAREAQPWFDPAGFLLHEEGGRLAGSCWTKVHRDTDPPLGEIYVISVDPAFHRRGLGRALTVAGLDHLAARGLGTGMLYVDGANRAAVALYRSLGFTVDHVDRAYALEVPPALAAATPPATPPAGPPAAQAPDTPTRRPMP